MLAEHASAVKGSCAIASSGNCEILQELSKAFELLLQLLGLHSSPSTSLAVEGSAKIYSCVVADEVCPGACDCASAAVSPEKFCRGGSEKHRQDAVSTYCVPSGPEGWRVWHPSAQACPPFSRRLESTCGHSGGLDRSRGCARHAEEGDALPVIF